MRSQWWRRSRGGEGGRARSRDGQIPSSSRAQRGTLPMNGSSHSHARSLAALGMTATPLATSPTRPRALRRQRVHSTSATPLPARGAPDLRSIRPMKASDIRRGHVLIIDGQPCRVMDFQHRTPGNLRAFVQLRLRNLTSGNTFDTRLSATEFVEDARLDTKEMQVMYRDSNGTHVMDAQNYEQYTLDDEITGDHAQWLEPGMTFQAEWLNGRPIAIMLPATAELEVVETA